MMFLATWTPPSLLLSSGPFHVYWYGALMAIGALTGYVILQKYGRKAGLPGPWLTDLFIALVIGGFVGARLYHVSNEWSFYSAHPGAILQIWNGGLAIHGAMLAGLIILWVMGRRQRIDTWKLLDLIALSLPLAQAIGRWGNYFNQELYGRPTSHAWKLLISPEHRLPGYESIAYYHPTFLYESLGCVALFAILAFLWKRRNQSPPQPWLRPGSVALAYFILYSFLRIIVETYRIDRVPSFLGLRLPLLTSIIIIFIASTIWIIRSRRTHVSTH